MSASVKIICNQVPFDVPEDLVPYIGKTLRELIDQHMVDSPDTPVELNSEDLRPEDFENILKFAKLLSEIPNEQQNLRIEKPLPSPDLKVWLKEYPTFHPFLQTLQADKESLFGLLIAGNFVG